MSFTKLFSKESIAEINEQIKNLPLYKKVLDSNEDKYIHGIEYDLSSYEGTEDLKQYIEGVCSQIYGQPLSAYNYWISISPPNSIVISHNHADSKETVFSSVLYTNAEPNCGVLVFDDIGEKIVPYSGMLVCFPPECNHSVSLNASDKDRVCIAFDFKLNIS